MSDPVDTFHDLIKAHPKLYGKTPGSINFWIGRLIQQFGTVSHLLSDLRAEHEGLERALNIERHLAFNMEDIHESHLEKIKRLDTLLAEIETHCKAMIEETEGVPYYREILEKVEGRQS